MDSVIHSLVNRGQMFTGIIQYSPAKNHPPNVIPWYSKIRFIELNVLTDQLDIRKQTNKQKDEWTTCYLSMFNSLDEIPQTIVGPLYQLCPNGAACVEIF